MGVKETKEEDEMVSPGAVGSGIRAGVNVKNERSQSRSGVWASRQTAGRQTELLPEMGLITQLGDFDNQNHYKTVILKIKIEIITPIMNL